MSNLKGAGLQRLEKLLLMLSSESDGEVVNAARAIGRTLETSGFDWHDLATSLRMPATAKPRTRKPPREDEDDLSWRVMVGFCIEHEHWLHGRECEFVTSLLHWHGELTEKQSAWLTAIYQRLRQRGAA